MELIIIDEREKYNASASANAFADKNTRNRVYVNTLGAETVLKYLLSENISISNIHNIHSIKKVLEEIDIADIMLPNIHIDVRVVYNENEIFIPKSHFEYNITPDIYLVIKPSKNYSNAEILGFFEPKLINKRNENKEYYFIEKEKLTSASELIEFIKNFNGNTRHDLSENETENCESMMVSFADNDISTADKKHILEQLVKSDDLRNKFIEFENFETLSYKAMANPSIIKDECEELLQEELIEDEIFQDETTNMEDNIGEICEEETDFNSDILENSSDDDEYIENEIEEIDEFENEFEDEFEDELEELEAPVETDEIDENIENNETDNENVDWNLIDGLENIGEVMAAGAAAVATTQNLANNAVLDVAENVISDSLEAIGEIFDNNETKEEILESSSFDELPEIENLIGEFEEFSETEEAEEDELPVDNIINEDTVDDIIDELPAEEDILPEESNIEELENIVSEITEQAEETETISDELPSETEEEIQEIEEIEDIQEEVVEEEVVEEELTKTGFGNTLLENLHAEEENISIENLEFENAEPEATPLEPFPEIENLEPVEDIQEVPELPEEENVTTEELPIIENSIEEVQEDLPALEPLEELPELESLEQEEVQAEEPALTETAEEDITLDLPEIEELTALDNFDEEDEKPQEIEEVSQELEEAPQEIDEETSTDEVNEEVQLPEIESLPLEKEELETVDEIDVEETELEENIHLEEIIMSEETEEPAPKEDLFASIDNILPDTIESIPETFETVENIENIENIEDIPNISALTSEIIPDEKIENNSEDIKPAETDESNEFDISSIAFDDNSELGVLYSENKPEPEIPESIPGAAFLQPKKPVNKKYLVAAALTVILAISALGFIKNKNNEIAEIPEIPQNTPAETPVDDNILEVNTPDITDEAKGVEEVQEVKKVEEIKKPTQEVKQDIKNNISTNKTPQAYVAVNKLVWDVPDNLSYSKNMQNYLRTAGKSIKLSLSADLLLATEYAYTNQVKLSLKLNKNGNVEDAQIISGSGSTQIDKIVLQSVKDTLNVVKPPANEISTPNFNLNLIIYF